MDVRDVCAAMLVFPGFRRPETSSDALLEEKKVLPKSQFRKQLCNGPVQLSSDYGAGA